MQTILVADDRKANRELLTTLLGCRGYRVLEAADGAEALEVVQRECPDLAIVDLLMPAMDGYEFVRRLREDPRLAAVRLVLQTASYPADEAETLARSCGVEYVLSKPVEPSRILQVVEDVLSRTPAAARRAEPEARSDRPLTDRLSRTADETEPQLASLVRLIQEILFESDREQVLTRLCAASLEIAGARRAWVAVRDDTSEGLRLVLSCGDGRDRSPEIRRTAAFRAIQEALRERVRREENDWRGVVFHGRSGRRNCVAVLVGTAHRLYAALCFEDRCGGGHFTNAEVNLVLALAGSAAAACESAALYQEAREHVLCLRAELEHRRRGQDDLRRITARLDLALDFGRAVAATLDLEVLLQRIVGRLQGILPSCDGCAVFEWSETRKVLVSLAASYPHPEALAQARIAPGEGMVGKAFREGTSLITSSAEETRALRRDLTRENAEAFRQAGIPPNVLSTIVCPLRTPTGRILGVLFGSSSSEVFGPPDLALLEGISGSAATALENVLLFEAANRVRSELLGAIREREAELALRRRAEVSLRKGAVRLERLSRRVLEVQEAERRRISRELHDQVGQALIAVKLNLQSIEQATALEPRAALNLAESLELIDRTHQQVRDLALDLRPSLLDDLGLGPALRWIADRQAQRSGLRLRFSAPEPFPRAAAQIETTCFRIAQEALANVGRHAHAHQLSVTLRADGGLTLSIHDDGTGFDLRAARARAAAGESLGLLGMEERAQMAGGSVTVRSTARRGTTVRVRLPLPPVRGAEPAGRER